MFPLFVLLLASCSSEDEATSNNTNNGSNQTIETSGETKTKDSNGESIYLDNNPIEDDKIKLEFSNPRCYSMTNYSLDLSISITNKEHEKKNYNIQNVELIKESTSAKYTVNYNSYVEIEAEMKYSLSFSANIPSDIKVDKYKLTFSINSNNYTYYLYEKPDELRVDRTINYYIAGSVVKTDTVKDGRTISNIYTYESSDYSSYCEEWYLDSSHSTKVSSSTIIKENTNLYGVASPSIKLSTFSSDIYSFVNGINHVPSNGILILPEKYLNKELAIGNYAIRNITVSKIYIPKTVHKIYGGNFTGIGNATIYYEGTETEWKALFNMQSDIIIKNVVYNTKAPK